MGVLPRRDDERKKLIADAGQMLESSVDAANLDEMEGVAKGFKHD